MTPKQQANEYRRRVDATGMNYSQWAKHCKAARSTIMRHLSGKTTPIPRRFILELEALERDH